jgi:hypothetical protein
LRFLETAVLILYGYTSRFPLAATAVTALPARSFLIDGEAIVTLASVLVAFPGGRQVEARGWWPMIAFVIFKAPSR